MRRLLCILTRTSEEVYVVLLMCGSHYQSAGKYEKFVNMITHNLEEDLTYSFTHSLSGCVHLLLTSHSVKNKET